MTLAPSESFAYRQLVSDCGSTPATASKITTPPSSIRRLLSTSAVKSTCHGVSIKLISLKDKFGDHGIIGSYVLIQKKNFVVITDFLLSCRILSRKVEEYIVQWLID